MVSKSRRSKRVRASVPVPHYHRYSIIPSPHHRIAALPYHINTSSTPYPPPHHPNSPTPHYPIAGRERQNTWRIAAYGAEPKCLENIRLRLLWPIKSMAYGIGAHGIWHYGPLPSKFGCLPNVIGLQNRVTLTPVAPTHRVQGVPGRACGRQVATQSRQRGPQSRHMAPQSRQRAPRCHPQGAQHRKFTKKALRSMAPSSAEP